MLPDHARNLRLLAMCLLAAFAAAALSSSAHALPAQLDAQVALPAAGALPGAGLGALADPLQPVLLSEGLVPVSLEVQEGALPLLALGPQDGADARAQSAPVAPEPPRALLQSSEAAPMAAVAGLAAAGTLAMKLEPVRRGLFLLALPLYSRLKRNELLENGVRERIYRALEQQPGLSIIQVCRAAKVGWGTAVYHLQRLERDKLVVSRRDGQYRRFFHNGHAPEEGALAPAARALQAPIAQRIAAFVLANPGCAQKDLCLALGIQPPLASKWLGRLLEAGLLTSQREWKLVRYAPTPALQERLLAAQAGAAVPAGVPA
jgi:DNA-binding transcriptional ArsR family regulator